MDKVKYFKEFCNIFCLEFIYLDAPVIESSTLTTTTIFNLPTNEMIKYFGKLGNSCTNDYFCRQSVSHSHCYNGKCSCTIGYVSIDFETCVESNCDIFI